MVRVEKRLKKDLEDALEGAGAEVTQADGPYLMVRTRDSREIAVEARWAGEGWPQDVRGAVEDVSGQWPEDLVVFARSLSPGAIEWLRTRGANWVDEVGQTRIIGPGGLTVIREPSRRTTEPASSMSFSWSPSAMDVAEAILARKDFTLRVASLSEGTGWSRAQVDKVLRGFDAQGWTVKHGAARGPGAKRVLVDPDGMLASWSAAVATGQRTSRIAHRAVPDAMEFLRNKIAPALDRRTSWAISGWAGLELVAPFASLTPSLHIYVADTDFSTPLTEAVQDAGLREVEEGGMVTFWAADEALFNRCMQFERIPVASAPRLFADLSSFGGRGSDAADHVKKRLIDPLRHTDQFEGTGDGG